MNPEEPPMRSRRVGVREVVASRDWACVTPERAAVLS